MACLCAASFLAPALAQAQTGVEAASSTGKGTVAGVLLGAEAIVLAEAVIGIEQRWAYLLGASVGAVGGGVGGYFLEDNLHPKTATLLLAGGLLLVIPATVAALSASSYSPPRNYVEDHPPSDESVEGSPGEVGQPTPTPPVARLRPPALMGLDDSGWSLGVPEVTLLDVYPLEMRRAYDLAPIAELRVSMFALRF